MPTLLLTAAHPPALLLQADTGAAPAGPNMWILLLGPLVIFWFLLIMPERKERKRKAQMIADIKKNDRVLTTGGMYATVAAVNENDLTIKFDDGPTRVRVLKTAIASVVTTPAEETGKTS
jgi:preprotein translocase subunit YajC